MDPATQRIILKIVGSPNQKLHNPSDHNKYILCLSPRYISGWHDESSESDTDPDQADTDENEASTPEIDEEDKAR